MKTVDGVHVWGEPVFEDALGQIKECAKGAAGAALMADHHVGYSMPIGGVVAYWDQISPSGVGFDIGCGNKAVLTDMPAKEARRKIARIMDDVFEKISFGIGQKNDEKVDHELFDDPAWKDIAVLHQHRQLAQNQLGTVGSGNHYVDVFIDEQERVWVGVHFGSRGIGHKVATWAIDMAGGSDGMFVPPVVLHVRSALGEDYLRAMEIAGRYAYAGRDWVCDRVLKIMGAKQLDEVHNNHNFAWKEKHGDQELYVVRKGATPAFPGQRGFVGGSMGDISVILEGVETEQSRAGFYSTVHGAGRTMSRTRAAGKVRKGKRTGGEVTRDMMNKWVREAGVVLRGAGTDESPHCYKRLPEVLKHHADSARVVHTLTPIGVAMAGENEFDPYRD
jgi:tRNA-splicing ligase RtcB